MQHCDKDYKPDSTYKYLSFVLFLKISLGSSVSRLSCRYLWKKKLSHTRYIIVKSHTDTGVEMLRVNIEELFQELTRHNSGEKFYRGSVCEGRQVQVVSVTDRCRL